MIQKKEKKIEKIKRIFHSVKAKLFITLCATVLCIIIFLIILNSFALEKFYLYSKENTLKDVYKQLNDYYNGEDHELDLESELEKIAIKNNFDILIKDEDNMSIYNIKQKLLLNCRKCSKLNNKRERKQPVRKQ